MRLPIDTSRLESLVVADVEPLRQYEERKPIDRVSVSSDWASVRGRCGRVEGRGVGPARAGLLRTMAGTRERLDALEVELGGVRGQLGEAA